MRRYCRATAILAGCALVLALAGCGGHPANRTAAHPCAGTTYVMTCVNPPSRALALAPSQGIDFAWSCPSPAGHAFGGSYLSPDPSKNWSAACVSRWRQAGKALVFFWEATATRALQGCEAGRADAAEGWAQGRRYGMRVLFLTVDFDESPSQAPAVASYFRCADQQIGASHVGGYGGYWTISRLFAAHLIAYGMQTYAWSGGLWDPRAQLQQYGGTSAVDYDRALTADYGQTPYTPPRPKPVLPVCIRHRMSSSACSSLKRELSSAQRAAAASQRAYKARGCVMLAQRDRYFAAQLHRHAHAPEATRWHGALASTRRAERRRACGTFKHRAGYFTGKARGLEARA